MSMVDFFTVIIIGLFTIMGIRSGLIKTAIRFGSLFLSLFIAFVAYPMFSEIIVSSEAADNISEKISTEYVLPYMENFMLENLNTDSGILRLVSNDIDVYTENAAELISDKITAMFVNVLSFLIIVVICRIAFALLTKMLIGISEIPIIRQINMLAGGIFGFLQGLIICILAVALIAIISPLNKKVEEFDKQIQDSKITSHIYNNNFILNSISDNR